MIKPVCLDCTWNKNMNKYPEDADPALVKDYQARLRQLLDSKASEWNVPEMGSYIKQLRREIFHQEEFDYSDVKYHFNELLLSFAQQMTDHIREAEDPVLMAVKYAMAGNYIDFAVLNVEEETLWDLIGKAEELTVDRDTYRKFLHEAAKAKTLTYITDNCGEIVMDKLLIMELKKVNPELDVTVMVRGAKVANDTTIEDAVQTGIPSVAKVLDNGTWMDGTILHALSEEARSSIIHADMVIAKGQANYESLAGCGLNVFYLFICKCALFMERFGVEKFSGVLVAER